LLLPSSTPTPKAEFIWLHLRSRYEESPLNLDAEVALPGNHLSQTESDSLHRVHVQGSTQTGSSMAYSTTKAAGLHLMKCLAATQGPKIRVNAILPGQLLTEWVCDMIPTTCLLRHACTCLPIADRTAATGNAIQRRAD
jgi:NAD(P)-dependent dehydrogenase (short-subunit alcohol dehydrogenase family)